jgi:hypothetical protein
MWASICTFFSIFFAWWSVKFKSILETFYQLISIWIANFECYGLLIYFFFFLFFYLFVVPAKIFLLNPHPYL